jgi:hypothetical protein
MTILALSNPIMSMSIRTRKLSKTTLLNKLPMKSIREILTYRIHKKDTNRSVKMSMNHSRESLIDGQILTTVFHKIGPCVVRKIIFKNDVIFMTTLRYKRCWTSNI